MHVLLPGVRPDLVARPHKRQIEQRARGDRDELKQNRTPVTACREQGADNRRDLERNAHRTG